MQPFHVSLSPAGVEVSRGNSNIDSNADAIAPSPPPIPASFTTAVTVPLSIANRYDFTHDLWEVLAFGWQVEVDGVVVAEGCDLMPSPLCPSSHDGNHQAKGAGLEQGGGGGGGADAASDLAVLNGGERGGESGAGEVEEGGDRVTAARVTFETASLPLPGEECRLTVTGRLRAATPWAAAGHVVGHAQLELGLPSPESVVRQQNGSDETNELRVRCPPVDMQRAFRLQRLFFFSSERLDCFFANADKTGVVWCRF